MGGDSSAVSATRSPIAERRSGASDASSVARRSPPFLLPYAMFVHCFCNVSLAALMFERQARSAAKVRVICL